MAAKPLAHQVFKQTVIAPMLGFVVVVIAIIIVPWRMFGVLGGHGFGWAVEPVDDGLILFGVGHSYAPRLGFWYI
jgi:hypothetical protein